MLSLIVDIFRLIVTTLYVKFRKTRSATVAYTGCDYTYTVKLGEHRGEVRTLFFESRQVLTTLEYANGILPKRVFTYEVKLTEYIGSDLVYREEKAFPQLCLRLLNNTIYPHLCAINVYMDIYQHWNRA